jgi:hypothetical protein
MRTVLPILGFSREFTKFHTFSREIVRKSMNLQIFTKSFFFTGMDEKQRLK